MKYSIIDLIPQRPPIVMVDEFIGIDNGISKTRFQIREDNIFVDNGIFSECGIIEHIAQSAAARVGYIAKSNNEPVRIGYIGSVNNFEISQKTKVGDVIFTSVEVLQDVMGISLIKAVCMVDDVEVASCKMKIFLKDD